MIGQVILYHKDLKKFLIDQIDAWSSINGGAIMHARSLKPNELPPVEMIKFPDRWNAGLQIKRIMEFAREYKIPMGIYEKLLE